jgi:hypothetical protein
MPAMLSTRPLASSALALLGLATTLGFARSARATDDLPISTVTKRGTDVVANVLTISATGALNVEPLRDKGKGLGQIHIIANKIIIEKGGILSATGAGSVGVNGKDGTAIDMTGGGKLPMSKGQPGGGGGYVGAGASGADDKCMPFAEITGGLGWAMPTTLAPLLGSAGGAANVTNPASAGGDGGGVILIEAAEIQLDGTIEAKGASPPAVSGIARGGGSGGFISIVTAHLTGTGLISVAGGAGSVGPGVMGTFLANNGGGGAGGVIFIHAADIAQPILDRIELKGGATGSCSVALEAASGTKTLVVDDPKFCVDADGDGDTSTACNGLDCDDSDATIHPKATELCNDVDDDCDGTKDNGMNVCSAGRTCDSPSKTCVAISDGGADGGVDAGAPPDHIAFESGCALAGDGGGVGALAMATLGAAALVVRRRRAAHRAGAGR